MQPLAQQMSAPTPSGNAGLRQRIIDHFVTRLSATTVEPAPFAHFYVEGLLPPDVYKDVLAKLPGRASYLPFNVKRWKNAKGESTRDRLCLSEDEIDRIEGDRAFWTDLTSALEADEVRRAVFSKLRDDIAIRLECRPDEVLDKPAYPNVMLIRDFEDYRIKPHPDGHPRVVTMQLYLAHEHSPSDLGTSLYTKLPPWYRLVGSKFREVKRFPFRPNSAYAIAVNDCPERKSYHGRELINAPATIRDSIIVTWLSRPEALGKKHQM